MEFGRLKGFWRTESSKCNNMDDLKTKSRLSNRRADSNNNLAQYNQAQTETLDEIKPEITAEGYGLRTPYGTHLDLDFVKYCEDFAAERDLKRTYSLRKPRLHSTSSETYFEPNMTKEEGLKSGPSNESLNSTATEAYIGAGQSSSRADTTLMETRRRLEAFRSFRSRYKRPPGDKMQNGPPMTSRFRNDHVTQGRRRGSVSSCTSTSGSTTPSGLGPLLSGNQQITSQQLHLVREQMAAAVERLKELEDQVKTIPVLEVKLSVLEREKKRLVQELEASQSHASLPEKSEVREKSSRSKSIFSRSKKSTSASSRTSSFTSNSPFFSENLQRESHIQSVSSFHRSNSQEVLLPTKHSESSPPPPPPPKRKYRSVAVGDAIPLGNVLHSSEGSHCTSSVGTFCNLPQKEKQSLDIGCIVKENDIDTAFGIYPPVPKRSIEAMISTTKRILTDCANQTELVSCFSITTQTTRPSFKTTGCGSAKVYEVRDASCSPVSPLSRDFSVMVSPPRKTIKNHSTTSDDLIIIRNVCVGNHVSTSTKATCTSQRKCVSKATTSDGLIGTQDVSVGPDKRKDWIDASVLTDVVGTTNASVECNLPSFPPCVLSNKLTMTSSAGGRWITYSDMVERACGSDAKMATDCKSSNTDSLMTKDQSTETVKPHHQHKSTFANICKTTISSSSNTYNISKRNCATDCNDILPILRNASTLTNPPIRSSFALQCAITKHNLVDAAVNTPGILKVDVATETHVEHKAKDIDSYVDKVQTLLEEQQSLLAENYNVFPNEWDEHGKMSRISSTLPFSNGLKEEKDTKYIVSTSSSSSASASVSSPIFDEEERMSSMSSLECDADTEDVFIRPSSLFLSSTDNNREVKSIMKKSGNPSRAKKLLRFTEVRSDDNCSFLEEGVETVEKEVKIEAEENKVVREKAPREPKMQEIVMSRPEKKRSCSEEKDTGLSTYNEVQLITNDVEENVVFGGHRIKYILTTEIKEACSVLERQLRNPKLVNKTQEAFANSLLQEEWFCIAAEEGSCKDLLEDFVAGMTEISSSVVEKVINMTDPSGNTVLHYAMSHGNLEVADSLISMNELDVNKANNSGYTAAMQAALYDIENEFEMEVFKKLFEKSNVNTHASEAGQTALMLAVSRGKVGAAQLLLRYGAEVNARDDDGSTALMCAAEHGQLEAVKLLLTTRACDVTVADADGSTALSIALDAGHREIAILLYAQMNFKPASRAKSPRSRIPSKSMIPGPIPRSVKS